MPPGGGGKMESSLSGRSRLASNILWRGIYGNIWGKRKIFVGKRGHRGKRKPGMKQRLTNFEGAPPYPYYRHNECSYIRKNLILRKGGRAWELAWKAGAEIPEEGLPGCREIVLPGKSH